MKNKQNGKYYYFILDDDRMLVNWIGPIKDAAQFDAQVVDSQKTGRHVRGDSVPAENGIEGCMSLYTSRGYAYTGEWLIDEPADKYIEFTGDLPDYARTANRNRIVKFACPVCGTMMFGEMTENYPGKELLRKSKALDYKVHCLKCGTAAGDPFNWTR